MFRVNCNYLHTPSVSKSIRKMLNLLFVDDERKPRFDIVQRFVSATEALYFEARTLPIGNVPGCPICFHESYRCK
jgi:hypothetical protein